VCRDGTARDDCRLASRQLARVGGGSAHMMHSKCGQIHLAIRRNTFWNLDKYILTTGNLINNIAIQLHRPDDQPCETLTFGKAMSFKSQHQNLIQLIPAHQPPLIEKP